MQITCFCFFPLLPATALTTPSHTAPQHLSSLLWAAWKCLTSLVKDVLETAPWACSMVEALPECERQRFKRNRAIQPRTAEETRQGPEVWGVLNVAFLAAFPHKKGGRRQELTLEHPGRLHHPVFVPNNSSCSQATSEEFSWLRWGKSSVPSLPQHLWLIS